MKKIALFFVPFLLLTSCEASRSNIRSGTNTSTTEDDSDRPTTNSSSTTIPYSTESGTSSTSVVPPLDGPDGPIEFWHNFSAPNSYPIRDMVEYVEELNDLGINITSKGSLSGLFRDITYTMANGSYPNIATARNHDLATYFRASGRNWYNKTGMLTNLNSSDFFNNANLNEKYQEKYDYDFEDDYYPQYMDEIRSYNEDDTEIYLGVPFLRSTEVMVYNGVFFDYAKSLYPEIKIPETWDEWATYGLVFRQIQLNLIGKYLSYDIVATNSGINQFYATNFNVVTSQPTDNAYFLDFSDVNESTSKVLTWNPGTNMFVTLIKQFGAEFTSFTEEDRHDESSLFKLRHGYVEFYSGDNKSKTTEAMEMVLNLAGDGTDLSKQIFGLPSDYIFRDFEENNALFAICETGGMASNISSTHLPRVAPIPYKDADHKFVFSPSINLAVFDQKCFDRTKDYTEKEMAEMCFKIAVQLTTSDVGANIAKNTGYFPVTKSASQSLLYKDYLQGIDDLQLEGESMIMRHSAFINQNTYLDSDASQRWIPFIDLAFNGSRLIRDRVDSLIPSMITDYADPDFDLAYFLHDFYYDFEFKDFVRDWMHPD